MMTAAMRRLSLLPLLAALAASVALPAPALGHGDEEAEEPAAAEAGKAGRPPSPEEEEELEIEQLSEEPARVLAQQAIALLEIRGEEHEAEVRVEAALISEDREDVDAASLERALDALAAGNTELAVEELDRALSQPLGAESGKSLHKAEQTVDRGNQTQESVAILAGAILLLLGAALLLAPRLRSA